MKILTTTLHAIDNCGSCLQAYALQQYLFSLGHQNEIIDYRPKYARNNGKPLKNLVKKVVFHRPMKRRWEIFDEFVKNYLVLTPQRFYTYEEIESAKLEADFFLTGSDQVWNPYFPCGRDPVYYLEFAEGKKISYAASIGKSPIPEKELHYISQRIKGYQAVSVREQNAPKELSACGVEAVCVCDPTLLHTKSFYENIMIKREQEGYLLVYLTEKSELLDGIVQNYRERYGGRVVYVGSFLNRCECDVNYTDVGPKEFLGLVAGAELVVAGSYHALLFSCIFEREFVILPYKNNARMEQFLQYIGEEERFVKSMPEYLNLKGTDWKKAERRIDRYREGSQKWLNEQLS